MRHLGLMALLATLLLSGCAALTKNMSQEPVDADHGSRTFGAFVEDGNIERRSRSTWPAPAPSWTKATSWW